MATSNAVSDQIQRMTASGDVLTGYVPVHMIIWDADDVALTGTLNISDSTGTVILVDRPQIASQHVGIFYPNTIIHNLTLSTMTGGAVIVFRGSAERGWNW